ncbi:uncharacterized protein PAC_08423 [Phialocephala subalpina]|uniref:Uncharacterized protein n=1 Tax=Phialocephala subalpina TaxID=576137 RepID=A0A1L7X0I9_9HELO|nr:uncharacterized protein PAC_08423 [Phialocephala subalpina]
MLRTRAQELAPKTLVSRGSVCVFTSWRNAHTWLMIYAIRHATEDDMVGSTAEEWARSFDWENGEGETEYPDIETAQRCMNIREKSTNEWDAMLDAEMLRSVVLLAPEAQKKTGKINAKRIRFTCGAILAGKLGCRRPVKEQGTRCRSHQNVN